MSKLFLNTSIACTSSFSTLVVGHAGQGLRVLDTNRLGPSDTAEEQERGAAGEARKGV